MNRRQQEGLRVAVVADAPLRAWAAKAAELLSCDPLCADTTVLIVPPPKLRRPIAAALLNAYLRLDRLVLARRPSALAAATSAALERVTVEDLPHGDALQARLEELAPQLLVLLGSVPPDAASFAGLSNTEVWVLRHGGVPAGRSDALLREFVRDGALCVSRLIRWGPGGHESELYASRSRLRRLSLNLSLEPIAWKSATFPARALELRRIQHAQPGIASLPRALPEAEELRLSDILLLPAALAARAVDHLVDHFVRRPTWSIVWQDQRAPNTSIGNFVPSGALTPPPDRFYADPFLARGDDGHYLFYEDFRRDLGRAAISVIRLDENHAKEGREVLVAPHHLSYPFVFRVGGDHYMVPESAQAGVVTLLRARRFPYEWEPEATLLSGLRAYDPTLLLHEGHWFLFVALPVDGAQLDELHLFWASELPGPYRPHPLNPIVSDACRARPAGRIIRDGGRLLRPGQDGSGGYGSAVVLSEILRLGPSEYEEEPIVRIGPSHRSVQGVHTIDRDGAIQVVDLLWLDRRFAAQIEVGLPASMVKNFIEERPTGSGVSPTYAGFRGA